MPHASAAASAAGPWARGLVPAKRAYAHTAAEDFAAFMTAGGSVDLRPRPAPTAPPRLSVILVLFNQAPMTLRCLRSLAAQEGVAFETVIVDNASGGETGALLERIAGATVRRNTANLGFLDAANQGAAAAQGEILLFLNNDTMLMPGALARGLARLAEDPGIGALSGRIVRPDGRLQEAGPFIFANGNGIGLGRGRAPDAPAFRLLRDVDYCCGAFFMVRSAAFAAAGGFDRHFAPGYYEEADFCFRLRKAGWRTTYDPAVTLMHYHAASAPHWLWPLRQMARNRGKFRARHAAALAGRPWARPLHYLRALRGRAPRGWALILRAGPGGAAQDRCAVLADALLDRGIFPAVLDPAGVVPALAPPFWPAQFPRDQKGGAVSGPAGLAETGLAQAVRALGRGLSRVVVLDRVAASALCAARGTTPGLLAGVPVVCDAPAFRAAGGDAGDTARRLRDAGFAAGHGDADE